MVDCGIRLGGRIVLIGFPVEADGFPFPVTTHAVTVAGIGQ